jgi:hypothetical protein
MKPIKYRILAFILSSLLQNRQNLRKNKVQDDTKDQNDHDHTQPHEFKKRIFVFFARNKPALFVFETALDHAVIVPREW